MEMERIAILVNDPEYTYEGLRSTLGLLVENLWVAVFFIDTEIELPKGKSDEDFTGYLEMLDDLEGELFTNVQANVDRFDYIKYLPLEDMPAKIKEYDLVVPF